MTITDIKCNELCKKCKHKETFTGKGGYLNICEAETDDYLFGIVILSEITNFDSDDCLLFSEIET